MPSSEDLSQDKIGLKNDKTVSYLNEHTNRCTRLKFYPNGEYLATASFDKTWKLWDLQSEKAILTQDGHAYEVYGVTFNNDGSIFSTGDLAGVNILWDIRSGQSIMNFTSHAGKILALDFAPNGYHLASASSDGMIHIHDIRAQKIIYKIAAHTHLVSDVKFEPIIGKSILSCGYDGYCKIWSGYDFSLIKGIKAHDEKVMRCDFENNGERFISASSDRTIKLWSFNKDDKVL